MKGAEMAGLIETENVRRIGGEYAHTPWHGVSESETVPVARARTAHSGFTLLEVIVTITILGIMSAAAIPILRNTIRSQREVQLREGLRELRGGIDRFHRFYELNPQAIPIQERTDSGYPKNLQILVDGFVPANVVSGKKLRFLRRIPIDPLTGGTEWGLRSYDDEPGSTGGSGEDVFDVFTRSTDTALNGTKYRDW